MEILNSELYHLWTNLMITRGLTPESLSNIIINMYGVITPLHWPRVAAVIRSSAEKYWPGIYKYVR